jgi:(Z)-2-((N-methylformamido)methylene)-5-hydroxybutyrolactone dehydrogenase
MATQLATKSYSMFVGGEWVDGSKGSFSTIDPFTGAEWATIPEAGGDDVDRAVTAARRAFESGPWHEANGAARAQLMHKLADAIRAETETLAATETRDNGKLLKEMRGQVEALPNFFEYYAGWADKLQGEMIPTEKADQLVYTIREPLGVVAAVTAWNSPLILLTLKLAPALAAGCTFVAKPAEQTSASTLELARIIQEVGFPDGVFNVVTGAGPSVGGALVSHPGVNKVAFTGSTATGISIAQAAAGHLAKASLELGGKSSNLVFADADMEVVTNGIVASVFAATGQTCLAGSRVVVHNSLYDELAERLCERAREIRLGDPNDPATDMGPIAYPEQRDRVLNYLSLAGEEGAEVLAGGGAPESAELAEGLFVAPTVLTGLKSKARVNQEEIFGPVVSMIPFETEQEAIDLANDVDFGLACGVWTTNIHRGHRVAAAVKAGVVYVNCYRMLAPSVPFGGTKNSGYGRENGERGLDEYLESKSVWVELSGKSRDPFRVG